MADRLILQDVTAECRLGVHDWERAKPQPIWIDVECPIDAARAAASDDVREALDYAELVTAVRRVANSRMYVLLETVAEEVARHILRQFKTGRVRVRVKKRSLPDLDYAAVEVERPARERRTTRRTTGRRRLFRIGRRSPHPS